LSTYRARSKRRPIAGEAQHPRIDDESDLVLLSDKVVQVLEAKALPPILSLDKALHQEGSDANGRIWPAMMSAELREGWA
jgi:hypothetical protein